jgi:hypothetical protein
MRPTFEQLTKILEPVVFAGVPDTCSVGKAREITEDCAYLIWHGYSASMTSPEKKKHDKKVEAALERVKAGA